jgi:hypothetical protein
MMVKNQLIIILHQVVKFLRIWKSCSSAGHRIDRKEVGYSLQGTTATKIFRGFNALGTIAFSFGDAMLPEIQVSVIRRFILTY